MTKPGVRDEMLTEEEARKKWCPMYRMTAAGTATDQEWHDNRDGNHGTQLGEGYCIASECMAWRWAGDAWIKRRVYKDTDEHRAYMAVRFPGERVSHNGSFEFDGHRWQYEYSGFDDGGEFDLLTRPNAGMPKVGYCGLAGEPK